MPGGHDEPSITFLVGEVEGQEHEGEIDGIVPGRAVISTTDCVATAGGDEFSSEREALFFGGAAPSVPEEATEGFAHAELLGQGAEIDLEGVVDRQEEALAVPVFSNRLQLRLFRSSP